MLNHFKVLGVHRGSGVPEAKDAYYRLSKLYHPDAAGGGDSAGRFPAIAEAWAVLSDTERRRTYENRLDALGTRCGGCSGRGYKREQVSFSKVIETACRECGGCGRRER